MPEHTRGNDDLPVDGGVSLPGTTPETPDINIETAHYRKHIMAQEPGQVSGIQKSKWLLQALKAWEKIEKDEEIKQLVEPLILEFINHDPIPNDPEINERIRVLCWYAEKCLIARRMMAEERNPEIPDEIRIPLSQYVEQQITEKPQMLPGEVHDLVGMLLKETHSMIQRAKEDDIFRIPGIRFIIAGDVIRIIDSKNNNVTEQTNGHSLIRSLRPESGHSSLRTDTVPGTPAALRKKRA